MGSFPLPAHRHVPGTGTRPDRAALEPVKALCPARVTDAHWRQVPPYLYGLQLCNAGYFWEAHEVWEGVWMATPPASRERHLLAALIQFANASLKLDMGQPGATLRLLEETGTHLAECRSPTRPTLMGIDHARLGRDVAAFAERVRRMEASDGAAKIVAARPRLDAGPGGSTAAG